MHSLPTDVKRTTGDGDSHSPLLMPPRRKIESSRRGMTRGVHPSATVRVGHGIVVMERRAKQLMVGLGQLSALLGRVSLVGQLLRVRLGWKAGSARENRLAVVVAKRGRAGRLAALWASLGSRPNGFLFFQVILNSFSIYYFLHLTNLEFLHA
jgi:hypothetical protein